MCLNTLTYKKLEHKKLKTFTNKANTAKTYTVHSNGVCKISIFIATFCPMHTLSDPWSKSRLVWWGKV